MRPFLSGKRPTWTLCCSANRGGGRWHHWNVRRVPPGQARPWQQCDSARTRQAHVGHDVARGLPHQHLWQSLRHLHLRIFVPTDERVNPVDATMALAYAASDRGVRTNGACLSPRIRLGS
jgi:glycine/D-amino acid oxidase-like deaminating enzyme